MRELSDRSVALGERDALTEARALDAERRLFVSGLAGKRIRVLRALVYEGTADVVFRQLGMSLPVGVREFAHGLGTITVNESPVEVLSDPVQVAVPVQPRIHLFDVDPDTLVGISDCDDGEPGWVVMQRRDPTYDDMTVIAPLADAHGELVWLDINDAVEVYQTGHVWKHDMGEGEPDELTSDPAGQEG